MQWPHGLSRQRFRQRRTLHRSGWQHRTPWAPGLCQSRGERGQDIDQSDPISNLSGPNCELTFTKHAVRAHEVVQPQPPVPGPVLSTHAPVRVPVGSVCGVPHAAEGVGHVVALERGAKRVTLLRSGAYRYTDHGQVTTPVQVGGTPVQPSRPCNRHASATVTPVQPSRQCNSHARDGCTATPVRVSCRLEVRGRM